MIDEPVNSIETKNGKNKSWPLILIICTMIVLLVALILGFARSCANLPAKYTSEILDKMSGNEKIGVLVGETLKECDQQLFQFKKRDLILFFQIARWRDGTKECSRFSGEITKMDIKPTLGQYSLAETKGVFETTFWFNLGNQKKWSYKYDSESKRLTVIAPEFAPPNVGFNMPGAKTPLKYKVTVDCVTFDEDTTVNMLKNDIPNLKLKAAERQLRFLREDARKSLKDFFLNFFTRFAKAAKNDINVELVFKDELDENSSIRRF